MERILLKNRVEALGMLLEEFDAEKYERTLRSEGREEGEERVNRFGILLTKGGFCSRCPARPSDKTAYFHQFLFNAI